MHLKQKDFMCSTCFGRFSDERTLLKHNKPIPSHPTDAIQCSKYFKIFQNPLDQIRHDSRNEEFDYMLCVFKSSTKDLVAKHVDKKHKLWPTYNCSKCRNWLGPRLKVILHWKEYNAANVDVQILKKEVTDYRNIL
jgi:hypothetical protein